MIIDGNSVAECWLKILKLLVEERISEISPLVVKINITDDVLPFSSELEADIDDFLLSVGQPCIETTAGTIFPISLYGGKKSIFERYDRSWKHIKTNSKNKRGTYFRRLTAYGEKYDRRINQLEKIISTYNGVDGKRAPVHRRSALIATTFDPTLDHTPQPQLGFPCLQQVCFLPNEKEKTMSMNAVYAMQYLSNRAFGNYVGLIRLGKFMGKEMGLELTQLNCIISVLNLGKMNKTEAKAIVKKYTDVKK